MAFFSNKTVLVFFLISQAKPTLWTLIRNAFSKVFLMNTDDICFLGEIRKMLTWISLLSGTMTLAFLLGPLLQLNGWQTLGKLHGAWAVLCT